MTDPDLVLDALAEISAQRQGSFAIVHADPDRNLYAQFLADGDAGLLVEVVGDEFLAPADRLTSLQQADMRARGWTLDPGPNWSRHWPDDSSDAARGRIVLEALGALREVYGAAGEVEVEVQIEGDEAAADAFGPTASEGSDVPDGSRRAVIIMAIAALILGLAIAMFVSTA